MNGSEEIPPARVFIHTLNRGTYRGADERFTINVVGLNRFQMDDLATSLEYWVKTKGPWPFIVENGMINELRFLFQDARSRVTV